MREVSCNVALVAFQCVLLILVSGVTHSTAWSTSTCKHYGYSYSYSLHKKWQRSRRLNGGHSSTTIGVIAESSSEVATANGQSQSSSSFAAKTSKHTLHLLSLPPTDDSFTKPGEFLVRECWKWKDSALGDGRDYFVPRPRALKAFHSMFVGMIIDVTVHAGIVTATLTLPFLLSEGGQSKIRLRLPLEQHSAKYASSQGSSFQSSADHFFSERFAIDECVVISNCARLDVLLVLKNMPNDDDNLVGVSTMHNITEIANIAARYAVAYNLHQQINSRRSKGTTLLERTGLSSWFDLPGVIETTTAVSSITQDQFTEINQLGQRLISIDGPHAISTHLCLVACGLAPRTNRPDREVIFRPYSSRDAHIMLQLKRTVEVISVLNSTDDVDGGGRGRIKTILDGALSAGKAARNEKIVPEIKKLKVYGSDSTPPSALAKEVADAALEQVVKGSVVICVARLAAMDANAVEYISHLRQRVNEVVASLGQDRNGNLQKIANKLLHTPTIQLRQGILSGNDIEHVVLMIENELISQFRSIG